VLTSQGRRPKQPLVFCPWIAQWMLLLIAPPPLAPSLGSSTQRERVCGGTKSCKTGGGFGSACMCCHRHPLSSPDHITYQLTFLEKNCLAIILWWSQSSYDEDYNLQTVDGQDDGQVVILHIMLNMNHMNIRRQASISQRLTEFLLLPSMKEGPKGS